MDVVGLVGAVAMAAAALYHLYIHQFADDMPSGKRRLRGALIYVTLVYAVWLLAGICNGASRDHLASRLEETEAKRCQAEETMDDYKKQNLEMMNNLVGMLSKNPASIKSMISYKVRGSEDDGTDNVKTTELSVTMKYDGQVHLPSDHHLAPTTKVNNGTTTTTVEENPWTARVFSLPPDHALFLDCVGGELTVHVQHQRYTGSGETCRAASVAPYLYESGLERTVFLARPAGEEEHAGVPQPWPPRDESSPVLVEVMRAVPEPIALTADVVVHYRTLDDGMIFLAVAPRNALGYNATATATRLSSEGSGDAAQRPLELTTRLHQASMSDSDTAALLIAIVLLVAFVLWAFFIFIYIFINLE